MRYAIVTNGEIDQEPDYLQSNYNVVHQDPNGQGLLIAGEDDHGWTMDDYVLPRLASGLIVAVEVWPEFNNPDRPTMRMDVPLHFLNTRAFEVKS